MPALSEEKWTESSVRKKIAELAPWFHNMDLMGVPTAPDHFLGDYPRLKWSRFRHVVPEDLRGMTVLDIGCNAGFYSMEMKSRGADRVLGIDWDEDYLNQARFAADVCGVDVEFRKLSVWDVAQLHEKFDLVIFMGVLYHLRHPLLALDLIHEHVAKDLLLFQSMQRGSRDVLPVSGDYDFAETEFSKSRHIRSCISWSIPIAAIRRIGGCRTGLAWRQCCGAPGSGSRSIPKRKFIFAGGRNWPPNAAWNFRRFIRRGLRRCKSAACMNRQRSRNECR